MRAEETRRDWRLTAALLAEGGCLDASSAIHAALRNDSRDPVELEIGTPVDRAVAHALLTVHRQIGQQEPVLGAATPIAADPATPCPDCLANTALLPLETTNAIHGLCQGYSGLQARRKWKLCQCVACWPFQDDPKCPGCEICEGPVTDCTGRQFDDDEETAHA